MLILFLKISPMYTLRQPENLISILNNVLIERHKNFYSAKQKQRKKALFWCSELDLTDRTHLRVQYTNSCELNNPVLFLTARQGNINRSKVGTEHTLIYQQWLSLKTITRKTSDVFTVRSLFFSMQKILQMIFWWNFYLWAIFMRPVKNYIKNWRCRTISSAKIEFFRQFIIFILRKSATKVS